RRGDWRALTGRHPRDDLRRAVAEGVYRHPGHGPDGDMSRPLGGNAALLQQVCNEGRSPIARLTPAVGGNECLRRNGPPSEACDEIVFRKEPIIFVGIAATAEEPTVEMR
ncbi:MAG: hypothetical protein KDK53_23880, partial [Maritimibacter sp.]|nr:hypothetical protein [Maritimibacter sp.]